MSIEQPARTHAQELYARARKALAGGVSSSFRASVKPEPLFVDHGQGAYLVDVNGDHFIDFTLAWGPLILGHSHPAIVTAIQAQVTQGMMFGAQHELEVRVAERLQASIPCADLVTFSNSGSEAALVALRLARAFTGRPKIVKFEGHYHGWTDSLLMSYHPPLDSVGTLAAPNSVPGTNGQAQSAFADVLILPWNDADALTQAFQQHGTEIAAVIMEPVMCNSGNVTPAPGYLAAARAITQHYDALLIFDEVITGFRLALGGAQALYGVTPDLAIYAKAIAGGLPLSAIAGRYELMNLIAEGIVQHSGTYNGNPLSLAAAEATLTTLSQPGVYAHLHDLGETLAQGARSLLHQHAIPALVHQAGPIVQILFTEQPEVHDYRAVAACNPLLSQALTLALRQRGILILPDGRWYLSTMHTHKELQAALQALDSSLAHIIA